MHCGAEIYLMYATQTWMLSLSSSDNHGIFVPNVRLWFLMNNNKMLNTKQNITVQVLYKRIILKQIVTPLNPFMSVSAPTWLTYIWKDNSDSKHYCLFIAHLCVLYPHGQLSSFDTAMHLDVKHASLLSSSSCSWQWIWKHEDLCCFMLTLQQRSKTKMVYSRSHS